MNKLEPESRWAVFIIILIAASMFLLGANLS